MDKPTVRSSNLDGANAKIHLDDITVAILAGGLGTRLQSSIGVLPKVLAPVCGRPFLFYLLDWLCQCGLTRVVLCTGHGADPIHAFAADYRGPLAICCSHEESQKGTAGALRQALSMLETPYVLAMNGDSYCGVHLSDYIQWHFEKQSIASLVLAHVDDVRRYGSVETDDNGQVVKFIEKTNEPGDGFINAGIYLIHRSIVSGIASHRQMSLEYEVLPNLAQKGLSGFKTTAPFIDIGTAESFRRAHAFFQNWPLTSSGLSVAEPMKPGIINKGR
ncbi:MAG: nucleotidyltransferase family protein [Desulfatitalea sp.]